MVRHKLILMFLCQEHGGDPDFQPSVNHSDVIIAKQRRKQTKFKNSTNVEKDQGSRMKVRRKTKTVKKTNISSRFRFIADDGDRTQVSELQNGLQSEGDA